MHVSTTITLDAADNPRVEINKRGTVHVTPEWSGSGVLFADIATARAWCTHVLRAIGDGDPCTDGLRADDVRYDRDSGLGAPWGGDAA